MLLWQGTRYSRVFEVVLIGDTIQTAMLLWPIVVLVEERKRNKLMNDRIREILSWYASENPGVRTNLARMLNHGRLGGTGKIVILPVDQGFEHGPARSFAPNPAAYDPHYHFELAIEAGLSAYASVLGMIEAGADTFAGQIPLILKLN